jgi:hypothetical protein
VSRGQRDGSTTVVNVRCDNNFFRSAVKVKLQAGVQRASEAVPDNLPVGRIGPHCPLTFNFFFQSKKISLTTVSLSYCCHYMDRESYRGEMSSVNIFRY